VLVSYQLIHLERCDPTKTSSFFNVCVCVKATEKKELKTKVYPSGKNQLILRKKKKTGVATALLANQNEKKLSPQ
jgi:hypothetical protein